MKKLKPGLIVEKESDGRYLITAVSTAAVKDQDDETFDVGAIDWDIKEAERTGDYPEFRVFHQKSLPIGKVEKMQRVGIFAVDQGHSYTDPFSLEVCEKMLATNDGKWRCSRGFYVYEASGKCPGCSSDLIINKEHMMIGFRCPTCKSVHMSYKGVLKEVHFRKARTFDVTITDIPCVPYTGVSAIKDQSLEAKEMLKSQLKQKLLDAKISEEAIDAKLKSYTDEQLKEVNDIPEAILKEFDLEIVDDGDDAETPETKETETVEAEQTFVLDPSVLKEFANIVDKAITKRLDGLEINVDAGEEKEYSDIEVLKDRIDILTSAVEKLTTVMTATDKERLKEILEDAPRNGKLRVVRFKSKTKAQDDEEDAADQGDDEEAEGETSMPMSARERMMKKKEASAAIVSGDGRVFSSMTQFVTGK